MMINLETLEDTRALGRALGQALAATGRSQLVLFEGNLGAGKTTLVRFITEALPGGESAEVSSPSFTLCNIYPTQPEIWHYDLYRLDDASYEEEILEALDDFAVEGGSGNAVLMLVEWPERLPSSLFPDFYIHCRLTADKNNRRASFIGHGKLASETLGHLLELLGTSSL